ncbi:MAG: efflux RND transporter permease subunit [Bdellovibrionota bacterium]
MNSTQYLRNPTAILLTIAALMIGGLISLSHLPIKMYPNMVKPTIVVGFSHGDIISPADLYNSYGQNFEQQLRSLDGVESVTAVYSKGRGRYTVEFEWDIDEDKAEQDIKEIFQPAEASSNNRLSYFSHSRSARSTGYMRISYGSKKLTKSELGELLNNRLRPVLEGLKGVDSVWVGGRVEPIKVIEVDINKLLNYQVDLNTLESAIKLAINSKNIGAIESTTNQQIQITLPASAEAIEDIVQKPIHYDLKLGRTLNIGDVARVTSRYTPDERISRLNGEDGSFMYVSLEPNGDVKRACDHVEQELASFQINHPEISYSIIVNPSEFIQRAIENLISNAVIGGLVAIAVIYFFLGAIKNTIIIAISIPFCIISSFLLMSLFGVTLNIVSLGGLAIGIGMIVDSSIVALENIFRRLADIKNKLSPIERAQEIIIATKEVAIPIAASILTSIVVFFPILYTKSYSKAVLGDLTKAVIFVLTTSILSALIIVPGLSYKFIQSKNNSDKKSMEDSLLSWLNNTYDIYLNWVLKNKSRSVAIIAVALMLFLASFFLLPFLKQEIIAKPNSKLASIYIELPENNDISLAKSYTNNIEAWLSERKEISSHSTQFWNAEGGTITAALKDRQLFDSFKNDFLERFDITPEANYRVEYFDPGAMPLPESHDLIVEVSGAEEAALNRSTKQVETILKNSGGITRKRPRATPSEGIRDKFKPWVDGQEKFYRYIQAAGSNGYWFTSLVEQGEKTDIQIAFHKNQQAQTIEELSSIPILIQDKIVPIKALAEISYQADSYPPLQFIDGVQKQQIFFDFKKNQEQGKKLTEIKSKLMEASSKQEAHLTFPDPNEEVSIALNSFKWALAMSIMLVFVTIAITFNSLKYPLIILITVPFSLIGVITGLWLGDSTISLNSMLGVILLSGLVVNNGILLIDFYQKQRHESKGPTDHLATIKKACQMRIRPILMTTLTTLFGALPIALAYGEGGKILQPLGIAVFFGLFTSTAMTLFVVPCLLRLIDSQKELTFER